MKEMKGVSGFLTAMSEVWEEEYDDDDDDDDVDEGKAGVWLIDSERRKKMVWEWDQEKREWANGMLQKWRVGPFVYAASKDV